MRSIIFVDVDGVLYPVTENPPKGYKEFQITPYKVVILNPSHGEWLLQLAEETNSELVWCTFWENDANEHIGPLIGLPELPVAPLRPWKLSSSTGSWKANTASQYAGDRIFAQFDDEWDVSLYLKRFNIPKSQGLHVKVGPNMGLSRNHIRQARNFLLTRNIVQ